MCDEMDTIQNQQLQLNALLVEAARQQALLPGESATVCVQCGETIKKGRRTALPGVQRCVECQSREERVGQVYSGKYR